MVETNETFWGLFWVLVFPVILIPVLILLGRLFKNSIKRIVHRGYAVVGVYQPKLSHRLTVYLDTSSFGSYWLLFQILLSVFACVMYVWSLYLTEDGDEVPVWFDLLEIAISVCFVVDYALLFVAASDKLVYFFSFFAMVDLFSVLPVFADQFFGDSLGDRQILKATAALRALRVLKGYKILKFSKSDLQRQIYIVAFTIISFIFCAAAFMQVVETFNRDEANLPFHRALYFIIVTFSTVGYGDITPKTELGLILMTGLIVLGLFLFTFQTGHLMQLIRERPPYQGSFRPKRGSRKFHVIVVGDFTLSGITEFFNEFFHKDHYSDNIHVVILSQTTPEADFKFKRLITHPLFVKSVTFLEGSALNTEDLVRVRARYAHACFVLSNKYKHRDSDAIMADRDAILQFLAVKEYAPRLKTYVQVMRPENKQHLLHRMPGDVLCLDEIKFSLLGQSCIAPGFSTLVTNLARSYAPEDISKWESDIPVEDRTWVREYYSGCCYEAYAFGVPSHMFNRAFADVAIAVFQKYQSVLLGVEVVMASSEKHGDARRTLSLNPLNYTLRPKDVLVLISEDQTIVDAIAADVRMFEKLDTAVELGEMTPVGGGGGGGSNGGSSDGSGAGDDPEDADLLADVMDVLDDFDEDLAGVAGGDDDGDGQGRGSGSMSSMSGRQEAGSGALLVFSQNFRSPVWAANYHILSTPQSTETLMRVDPSISGHIVLVAGMHLAKELVNFILPLRSKKLRVLQPVVILHNDRPTDEFLHVICNFDNVYIMQGSIIANLQRAGIRSADKVVVLSSGGSGSRHDTDSSAQEYYIDSNTIIISRAIRGMSRPATYVFTELARGSSMKLLLRHSNDDSRRQRRYLSSPTKDLDHLMAHEVLTSGLEMVDMEDVSNFLMRKSNDEVAALPQYHLHPQFTSGNVYTSSMLDTLICQVFYNPYMLTLTRLMVCGRGDQHIPANSSAVFLMRLPDAMHGGEHTFGELFVYLVRKKNFVPIALYRARGTHGAPMPYVFTCPLTDTPLVDTDRVYVLSVKQPNADETS